MRQIYQFLQDARMMITLVHQFLILSLVCISRGISNITDTTGVVNVTDNPVVTGVPNVTDILDVESILSIFTITHPTGVPRVVNVTDYPDVTGVPNVTDIPGVKSIIKCSEYRNTSLYYEHFRPLSEDEMEFVRKVEDGYIPENAFVGGYNARPKEMPFMAALGYENDNQTKYLCGGTLISEKFVLTAAHCLFSRGFGKIKYIRLGDLNLSSTEDDVHAQQFGIKEYYVHPKFQYPKQYHDIALIKLNSSVKFTDYISPACVEPQRTILLFTSLFAAGWGALGHEKKKSNHLQIGMLKHFGINECQKDFNVSRRIPEGIVDDFQICAGSKYSVTDTCKGDSGGPLVYVNDDEVVHITYITGITSFGKPCGVINVPGIYTRVAYYIDWIERIVWA